jgi:D-alanyl-lipoteichoic acid acyltransferase DltB (MBOAT superfamily)
MFYPQLVAGPIERPQNMLRQFYEEHFFESSRISAGLKLMLWGFFKKLVIADRLSIYVNAVYNNHMLHNGTTLLVATLFFTFQIYCDFSGYSDIAIGSAKVLGFDIMVNFKRPYFSSSIREFWSRWHISLSTWFRDYLYIPLGGNRVPRTRWYYNILFVFMVSGIWHGANWTFAIWGLLHGLLLIFSDLLKPFRAKVIDLTHLHGKPNMHRTLSCIFVFALVSLTWVFFRATTISQALEIVKRIFIMPGPLFIGQQASFTYSVMTVLLLLLVETDVEFLDKRLSLFEHNNPHVRIFAYSGAIILILMIGVLDGGQFIYFQF